MYSRVYALILVLEKRLKTDLRYLLKGGFWLSLGQVVSSLSVFLLGLAFANLLPKEVYGTYKYLLSVAGLLAIFSLPGMSTALLRSVARGYDKTIELVTRTRVTAGLLGAFASIIGALYYAHAGNTTLASGLAVIAVFLPFFDTFNAYGPYLQGKQNFKMYVMIGALVQIASVASIITVLLITRNLLAILTTYFLSYTLFRFLSWRYVQKIYPPQGEAEAAAIPYGKHLTIIGILGQLAAQADTLLTFHFLGAAQVAIYSIAIAAPDQIKNVMGSVSDLLFPRLAQRTESDIRESMLRKSFQILFIMILVIGAYITIAPFLYSIFFPRYPEAIYLSQIFTLSLVNFFFSPATVSLQAHGKVRELYYINIMTPIFQIVCMLTGIIYYGLMGLIVARIATRIVGGLLNFYFFYQIPIEQQATS